MITNDISVFVVEILPLLDKWIKTAQTLRGYICSVSQNPYGYKPEQVYAMLAGYLRRIEKTTAQCGSTLDEILSRILSVYGVEER